MLCHVILGGTFFFDIFIFLDFVVLGIEPAYAHS